MNTLLTVLLTILTILIVLLVALYFFGKKMEEKQLAQKEALEAHKQTVSMLIIDKKKLKIKESGLPKMVYEQTPKYMRFSKVPIVKAKVGPKIMSLMCDQKVFNDLPIKSEAKVVVSGIYITDIKSVRGGIPAKPKKQSFFDKFKRKNK